MSIFFKPPAVDGPTLCGMNTRFEIFIPPNQIDDLQYRLAQTRFPNVPNGSDGKGFSLREVKILVKRWKSEYNWRTVERQLNELHHELVDVGGEAVHVVHERGGDRLPVVLLHGWPDSFFGMHRLIPPLTGAGHDVVVPSLPGYGFSSQPDEAISVEQVATTIDAVLTGLGHQRYAVHGGDWGSALAEQLALSRPERVAAVHLLDVPYHHQFMVDTQDAKDDAERAFLTAVEDWGDTAGYVAIQSTQPLTLGYGLADSPAGLLSWIGEKYTAWTDRQPDPDDVLTQASIYWFTNTIYSSMRLYAEGMDAWDAWEADGTDRATGDTANWSADASAPEEYTGATSATQGGAASSGAAEDWSALACTVPAGFALHPADIATPPRVFAERFFADIRRYSVMPAGGHFAAMEEPEALAAEVVAFLADL